MSRTYRKNSRWFYNYKGEFYSSYSDRTIKGKYKNYKDYDWRKDEALWGASRHFAVVLVGESESYSINCPSDVKTMCHRIDRARFKQALLNEDDEAYILPSFDPWDWD